MMHGLADDLVAPEQSIRLYKKLREEDKEVEFYLVENAKHGDPAFWTEKNMDIVEKIPESTHEIKEVQTMNATVNGYYSGIDRCGNGCHEESTINFVLFIVPIICSLLWALAYRRQVTLYWSSSVRS